MGAIIGFSVGYFIGLTTAAALSFYATAKADEPGEVKGIDPDELIAWIRNSNDNYEYIAPPSTSEIIRKIKEMSDEVK